MSLFIDILLLMIADACKLLSRLGRSNSGDGFILMDELDDKSCDHESDDPFLNGENDEGPDW